MKITDEYRLGYLMETETYIGWNRDGEACRIFSYQDEDGWLPVCGWDEFFYSGKDAIDAAMKKSLFLSRDWES